MKTMLRRTPLSLALLSALSGSVAHGAGFAIIEQSVPGLGNAFAGAAASANDPGTVYFNPAGMTQLRGTHLAVGAHLIDPSADYEDRGTTLGGVVPISGDPTQEGDTSGVAPNFYYLRDLSDQLKFGLGLGVPFGLATEYDDDWVGRYHAIKSDLKTININPSLAFQVNDALSLGVGVSAQYIDVELSNAIDFGALIGGPAATGTFDGKAKVEGDDWSFGFNFGALYEISDRTRVGIAYRSKISHDLEGDAKFSNVPPPVSAGGLFMNTDASASVDLPETLAFGFYHDVSAQWAVMAGATWTHWSRFEELRIEFDGPQPDSVQPEQWENSWRYSLGVNYKPNRQWVLRGGVAFDESPIPSDRLRTPRIPGNDRRWLALGASYQPSDRLTFDVSYAHLFVSDTDIANANEGGALLVGTYESDTDLLAAQVRMHWD